MNRIMSKNKLRITMQLSLATLNHDEELALLYEGGVRYLCVPPEFYDQGEAKVRERQAALNKLGFVIDTCHPPFGGGNQRYSLCAEDEQVRQGTIRTYQRYLRAFAWTGMRAIPIHTGGAMHPAAGPKALARLTDTLKRLLPVARDSGVILALENTFYDNPCPFSDALSPSGVEEKYINDDCVMLRNYVSGWNDSHIRVCHDVGHSVLYGHRLEEDLNVLFPLTALYHVHGNDCMADWHWNIGQGSYPWETLRKHFEKHPYVDPIYDEVLSDPDARRCEILDTPAQIIQLHRQADRVLNG